MSLTLTTWSKALDWLFNQRKDIVVNFIWVGIFILYVAYFQPRHLATINAGYENVQRQATESMVAREQRVIDRLQQIEIQLQRFNTNLEKRDEAQSRLIESLVRERSSK